MGTLISDARYALRSWRRTPGAIAAALAALAVAIGAATAVFSLVDCILLRPLPYPNPDRLVMVWQDLRARGGPEHDWISPGLFVEWQQRSTVFAHLAAVRPWAPNLTGIDQPERLRGASVSAAYFDAIGVPPAAGRTFSAADDTPNGPPVAVISHGLWQRVFGADPTLVGRSILLDGVATTVIGVMPATLEPPVIPADVWSPIRIDPANAPRGIVVLRVLAQIKPGVTLAQARGAMSALATQLEREDPEWERARVAVVPLFDEIVGSVRQTLLILATAVVLVIAIAIANVAGLLLARAVAGRREMTIRTALGAGWWRIARQQLTEAALIAAAGGLGGVLLARWSVAALVMLAPPGSPRLQDVRIDGRVFAVALIVTLVAAVVAGLAPGLVTSRLRLNGGLRDGGREHTAAGRSRTALVTGEIAVALVLTLCAVLLIRSLHALHAVDLGFAPDRLLTASLVPPRVQYRDPAAVRQLYRRLLDRAAAIPGVEAAALTNVLPLSGADMTLSFHIEGRPEPTSAADDTVAWTRIVSPSYVKTMGMRLTAGRDLSNEDSERAPGAVLINETMKRKYWAGASPLGARLQIAGFEATVVGVVADVHHRGPATTPSAEMFVPFAQFTARQVAIVLRTAGDPADSAAALRAAMRDVDPSLPLASVATMRSLLGQILSQAEFLAILLGGFAVLASLLAAVGIYGLMSFVVNGRVRELAVRVALGARRGQMLWLVLGRSAAMVAAGVAAGTVAAAALSRVVRSVLFGVSPGDPATLVLTSLAVAAAAMLATVPPALRASRTDPVVALREE